MDWLEHLLIISTEAISWRPSLIIEWYERLIFKTHIASKVIIARRFMLPETRSIIFKLYVKLLK